MDRTTKKILDDKANELEKTLRTRFTVQSQGMGNGRGYRLWYALSNGKQREVNAQLLTAREMSVFLDGMLECAEWF